MSFNPISQKAAIATHLRPGLLDGQLTACLRANLFYLAIPKFLDLSWLDSDGLTSKSTHDTNITKTLLAAWGEQSGSLALFR